MTAKPEFRSAARPLLPLLLAALLSPPAWADAVPGNQAILKAADEARGNVSGMGWEVSIESKDNERTTDTLVYDIKVRAFNIAGTSLAPAKYRGNKILMLNTSMWFYKPGLSKPVPVSQRQKLMGEAAYGDIASTNYAENYAATRLPDETVDGEPCYVFDLKAKEDKLTYDRIVYWVSKQSRTGIKADYYTVSGKKFKSATMDYGNAVRLEGQARPFLSRITLRNELMNGSVTYLNLRSPRVEPVPDYVFDLNLFMR
ncbi:outer membrane lipoprotein-sorting protein [Massilia niastensis]|uniref:outer membrane lipoprotein-sorting protein n=1 Tax=Massilia niastensis TaxID=544911 RepID=UPI000371106F|nr:outer membrane lipoprotein-sorting protein [Massilia niastensis]